MRDLTQFTNADMLKVTVHRCLQKKAPTYLIDFSVKLQISRITFSTTTDGLK